MTNLYDAHRQWLVRPPDERFPDLDALYAFTNQRKGQSSEEVRNLHHVGLTVTPDSAIAVNGDSPPAYLTNWAFTQLGTAVGAPPRYLRTLPPEMVCDCLDYGLRHSDGRCKIMLRTMPKGGGEQMLAAAFTGPAYGRIWDADVVESLMAAIAGTGWHVPPARPNYGSEHSGLYASDRDVFAFLVNDEQPVEVGNARLGRGFFIWNSETGAASFGLTTFLYNYVCGNHIVWGAEHVSELRIIHRHKAPDRFYRDALPILNRFVENRPLAAEVTDMVGRATEQKTGTSLEEVLSWFAPKPFTKREVTAGYQAALEEGDDPANVWGMVQGLTAHARRLSYTDARVDLERRAGALLR